MTVELSGRRVLVTGAGGLMAFPIAMELAKDNEVYAVSRFTEPEQRRLLDAAGVRTIAYDVAEHDMSPLPKSVDVVFNMAVVGWPTPDDPAGRNRLYEINTGSTGRLASRYRDCEAFVQGGTGSVYAYTGERPLHEDDKYGMHIGGGEVYSASKVGMEFLLRHLSEDYGMPTVILRIFSPYAARGGGVAKRIDRVARGLPVSVYPGARNIYTPIYEDDFVEKTIASVKIASTPVEIINMGGEEPVTVQEYCAMGAELLGVTPIFEETSPSYPIWADTTRMVEKLGPCKVSMREGVRRVVEAGADARVGIWTG
jgi:nucleoside-diphosphate-sugar epimerase